MKSRKKNRKFCNRLQNKFEVVRAKGFEPLTY